MAKRSKLKNPRLSFCNDCSIAYKRQMIKEDRCEYPETVFITVITEDGELEDIGYNAGNQELS